MSFLYFRNRNIIIPTSKLTEPLWSVSNALNRKWAYVEASTERTNMKSEENCKYRNICCTHRKQLKGNFCGQLQRITMYFLLWWEEKNRSSSSLWTDISKPPNVSLLLLGNHLCDMMSSSLHIQNTPCLFLEGSTVWITWPRAHMTQTSLREELSVDVFKSVLVDDSAGTLLKDREVMHV